MTSACAPILVRTADLDRSDDAREFVRLLDAYARDPKGANRGLADSVKHRLIADLRAHPTVTVFLAYAADEAVGFATCFGGYSTFRARPLLNIHDIAVLPEHRGRGIGRRLLATIADYGRRLGCCKLTLEVREDNPVAAALYREVGFRAAEVDGQAVQYLFLERELDAN